MRRLSSADWALLSVVLIVQVLLGIAVRIVRVRQLSNVIAPCRAIARRVVVAPEARVAWAIEAVGRRLPAISTCLVRALAADLLLSAPGREGRIRIGIRRAEKGGLESHAWFECAGRIVVGAAGAGDYAHLITLATDVAGPA